MTPSLKAYGIPGRARLFEVVQRVREENQKRAAAAPGHRLEGTSYDDDALKNNPSLAIDYVIAPPRMALYMEYSTKIYNIYLKYVAPEDIHVYSIDEVMMDVTSYLRTYGMSARELARTMIQDVLAETNITATAGIGTNLYLCKIVESPSAYGFLACRCRLCTKTGRKRHVYDGRCGALFDGEGRFFL